MARAIPAAPGRIFISYRREDTAYPAGWLYDRLTDRFADGQVFKDIDSIKLGDDFVAVITKAVGSCDVLLALIGNQWLTVTDENGRRRLDAPDDFVRLELEAALARNVRVIPILVEGARMPRAAELPSSLAGLVRRQALELSSDRFDADTGRLLRVLDDTLTEAQAQREAEAQNAAAGAAAPGLGGATPSQVSAGKPEAAPLAPRWRGFDRVQLLRRRHLLLGAGAVAVTLAIIVGFLLLRDGDPRNPLLSVRGSIDSPGAQDRYAFTTERDQEVLFDARECAATGTLVWTLLRPDDEPVFQEQTMCDADSPTNLTRTLPQAGDYRLIISGSDNATGTYHVTLWSVPAPQQFSIKIGDTIAPDQPAKGAGNIESPGAQDHYTFTADKGQRISLVVRECASSGTLVWALLRPDDEPVFPYDTLCSGDTTAANQEVTLPQAGDYRLIVRGSDNATGTYHVKLNTR